MKKLQQHLARIIQPVTQSMKGRVLAASAAMLLIALSLIGLAVTDAFVDTLQFAIRKKLAAEVNVMLGQAKEIDGKLVMPEHLPNEKYDQLDYSLLGLIYDEHGNLLWQSRSVTDSIPDYTPVYEPNTAEFTLLEGQGLYFAVYDLDLTLSNSPTAKGYSFITIARVEDYADNISRFLTSLRDWSIFTIAAMLASLWLLLLWSLLPLKQVSKQLAEIEADKREQLNGNYPREIRRLTDNLNKLLHGERCQRERYRHTMSDLAHSLKTPLSVLNSTSENLSLIDNTNSSTMNEVQLTIQEQILRMNQIINYQLQRAVVRHKTLVRNTVNIRQTVNDLGRTLAKVYMGKGVHFENHTPENMIFSGDEQDLMEVLGNLLDNAWKYCHRQVSISCSVNQGHNDQSREKILVISIEDDGQGIPPNYRKEVLKRGIRADSFNPGQGIGLSIVQDILEIYEGHLSIDESSLGGAAIKITLVM